MSKEAKVILAESKVQGLEVKCSKMRKDLILAMDGANTAKEKVRVLYDDLRTER